MKNILKRIIVFIVMLSICISIGGCASKQENKAEPVTKIQDKGKTEIITLEKLKTIPEFKCTDVDGKEISSEIFKESKLTLLNVWGTWCSPCVGELPELEKLYKEMKDKGVNIVGVVEDGMKNEEAVKKVLEKNNVTYVNIIPDEKFYNDFIALCQYFPSSILVDNKGNVVAKVIRGIRSKEAYANLIEEALKNLK